MAVDVVTRFRLQPGDIGTKDVVTRFRVRTVGAGRRDVITRARFRANTAVVFTVGFAPPLKTNFNPFENIPLTVSTSLTADTVTVTQVSGPSTLVISGTGLNRASVAPAKLTSGTYTLRVTAVKVGYTTVTSDYTFTVIAHGGFYRKSGAGVRITTKQGSAGDIRTATFIVSSSSSVIINSHKTIAAGSVTMTGSSSMVVTGTVTSPVSSIYFDPFSSNY